MSQEHLIPITTHERAVELGREGGLAKSEAKSQANAINPIKHGKYAKKVHQRIAELVKNPEASAIDIFNFISRIEELKLTPDQLIRLGNLKIHAHQVIHKDTTPVDAAQDPEMLIELWRKKREESIRATLEKERVSREQNFCETQEI